MNKLMNRVFLVGSCLSLFLLTNCASPESKVIDLSYTASASGPFFEGVNSLIAEADLSEKELIKQHQLNTDELASIQLQSATIQLDGGSSFENYNSAALSLVSNNAPMQSVAILNPIKSEDNTVTLTVSNEAELLDFIKDGKFSLVTDLDFKSDDYAEELSATIELKLILNY